MVKFCLNMIVKNEVSVITRLLNSVIGILDTYFICDTGSTDDTKNVIQKFFESNNIKGIIISEPFVNFGYNRTFAFNKACEYLKKKINYDDYYILLLDADMELQYSNNFLEQFKIYNNNSFYTIEQTTNNISYSNTRIIKATTKTECIGATHEYWHFNENIIGYKLLNNIIWINDIGDGGCKSDKIKRDLKLLYNSPQNERTLFYLANTLSADKQYDRAVETYKKRIDMGGWVEEVFMSYYNMGLAQMMNNCPEEALISWNNGWKYYPKRAETIYEICKHLVKNKKYLEAYNYFLLGKSIPFPDSDVLFVNVDAYEFGFDYEYMLIGYYVGDKNMDLKLSKLLTHPKVTYTLSDSILVNLKHYVKQLINIESKKIILTNQRIFDGLKYYSSSSCLFFNPDEKQWYINIRYVNYIIDKKTRQYINEDSEHKIITKNILYKINLSDDNKFNKDNDLIEIKEFDFKTNGKHILGIEDFKLSYSNGNYNWIGTCECENNNLTLGFGKLNSNFENITKLDDESIKYNLNFKEIISPFELNVEKNWAMIQNSDFIIYSWCPLVVGKIDDNTNNFIIYKYIETTNSFFTIVKGSTNGIIVGDEIWFLTHVTSNSYGPRNYYHLFVVLNKDLNKIIKWSKLFKLGNEKCPIEFALGLEIINSVAIISYSTWDETTNIEFFPIDKIEWINL